jgi:hypothetical protein
MAVAPDVVRTHLFIAGLHRSGTSALHDMFRAHPAVTGFRNTGAPKDEGQHLQNLMGRDGDFGGPGAFCFDPAARLTESDALSCSEAQRAMLVAAWEALWEPDRSVRIEKSPPNLVRSRFLQAIFPDARFIFIVRHPLAVSRATAKWSRAPFESLMRHWVVAHRIMLEDIRRLRRAILIRYEDLANDIDKVWPRLLEFAGLPAFAAQPAQFSDHNHAYFADAAIDSSYGLEADHLGVFARFGYALDAPLVRPADLSLLFPGAPAAK